MVEEEKEETGDLVKNVRFAFVLAVIGVSLRLSCAPQGRECACEDRVSREATSRAKPVPSVSKDPAWCDAAIRRGYLTKGEMARLKKSGHIRWVEARWESPPGWTWERVLIPRSKDRFRYIRSDFQTPVDPATIDVVMFETDHTLQSTKQLVVKAKLGSYSPARIHEFDIIEAYDRVREGYLREIGEEI